ncbi:MAG: hypothetical protein ABSG95_04585 [Solirubrobacteraceae bacterium]
MADRLLDRERHGGRLIDVGWQRRGHGRLIHRPRGQVLALCARRRLLHGRWRLGRLTLIRARGSRGAAAGSCLAIEFAFLLCALVRRL